MPPLHMLVHLTHINGRREICLSLHIASIRAEYKTLLAKHGKNPVQAVLNLMSRDLSLAEMLTLKTWASIWSVYSLYDTSYSNQESFGFFVDFGNGWVTILPTALMLVGMTFHGIVSARVLGLINLVAFYQECYGTVMYVVSYLFNKRYVDRSPVECALVVGISNSLWFFFPIYGMYLCYDLIVTDSYSVFL